MKLKQLLEGYAWERNADGSLPTLADAVAKHEQNIKEQKKSKERTVNCKSCYLSSSPGSVLAIRRFSQGSMSSKRTPIKDKDQKCCVER